MNISYHKKVQNARALHKSQNYIDINIFFDNSNFNIPFLFILDITIISHNFQNVKHSENFQIYLKFVHYFFQVLKNVQYD